MDQEVLSDVKEHLEASPNSEEPEERPEEPKAEEPEDDVVNNAIFEQKSNPQAKIVLLVGKPESGKSYLVKSLLYENLVKRKYFKFGYVACSSLFNGGYDYLPSEWCHKFDEENIFKYTEKLKSGRAKSGKQLPPNFLILDDNQGAIAHLIYSSKGNWFETWLMSHRHTNTTVFICAQTMRGLGSYCRSTASVAFMFNTNHPDDIKSLFANFGAHYESHKDFKRDFLASTKEKYEAFTMVAGRPTKQETFFVFKANEVPENLKFTLPYKKEAIPSCTNDVASLPTARLLEMHLAVNKRSNTQPRDSMFSLPGQGGFNLPTTMYGTLFRTKGSW